MARLPPEPWENRDLCSGSRGTQLVASGIVRGSSSRHAARPACAGSHDGLSLRV